MPTRLLLFLLLPLLLIQMPAKAAETPVHGLWVWKTKAVLEPAASGEALRDFAKAKGINEVYLSVSSHDLPSQDARFAATIDLLHRADIRVEALFGSDDADKPGKQRDALVDHVRLIVKFNDAHPGSRFDGIHLDIEPHQRAENKGPGNLKFLADLVDTFRAVGAVAAPAHLTVNADIANKFLKGTADQRKALLGSVDRVTLMLYELSSPSDGQSNAGKTQRLRRAAEKYLAMAYDGLDDPKLAKMAIALRTPDYVELLSEMLKSLDEHQNTNPRYLGWAMHSYNDHLKQ